jgi:hypothetical protein
MQAVDGEGRALDAAERPGLGTTGAERPRTKAADAPSGRL